MTLSRRGVERDPESPAARLRARQRARRRALLGLGLRLLLVTGLSLWLLWKLGPRLTAPPVAAPSDTVRFAEPEELQAREGHAEGR